MAEAPSTPSGGPAMPAFIADLTVGRLAKWLRWLGYDTLFLRRREIPILLRILDTSARILLTRRRRLAQGLPAARVLFIEHNQLMDQLRQVVTALSLDFCTHRGTRCMRCNELLAPRRREEVRGQVPAYTYQTHERFSQCPGCGRIYWEGTHRERMEACVEAELRRAPPV
ncbi:MAG: hypothetical protein HYY96_03385 [Candidatus Tectomicrobia bacterium]|nr:hypothetical protein [Candidatus Tectomicrobia bacterium]